MTVINPALHDLERVRRDRNKVLLKSSGITSSLSDIMNFQTQEDDQFIQKMELMTNHQHIVLQDDDMVQQLKEGESHLQTDTIEGFLHEPKLNSKQKPNLTITTGYNFLLGRWVHLCISILMGKSTNEYKKHWDHVLSVFEFVSLNDFKMRFPGNTSDFSDAIRKGYFESVKDLISIKFSRLLSNQ